jgi:hypothetical protein
MTKYKAAIVLFFLLSVAGLFICLYDYSIPYVEVLLTLVVPAWVATSSFIAIKILDMVDEIRTKQPPDSKYWEMISNFCKAVDANETSIDLIYQQVNSILDELKYLEGMLDSESRLDQFKVLELVKRINSKKTTFKDNRTNPRLRFLVTKFISMFELLAKDHPKNSQLLELLVSLKEAETTYDYYERVKNAS